mmetsp:Transcript_24618/g.79600  ORF Transcript_24618/g.79600 Transcript_24618/m.79600 type:complete len:246 (-) Transcript_24618:194-931(-)|eukprot:CAMPEP_0204176624 /NCGR_PEP_ID=MMETSP0361-20130328/47769_1 /ASSEMBLY_ACC=CAM_ASM_000343 /TAXON_ID=268821 /ORGANISM="Scrippsiella Hangoei, Strain SHTV-5" /LENGTH=245 /DNA_ID=CAMNT_0051135451 /DNA_START=23 /DNA_END=760 /DNA_ORIENTATION=-
MEHAMHQVPSNCSKVSRRSARAAWGEGAPADEQVEGHQTVDMCSDSELFRWGKEMGRSSSKLRAERDLRMRRCKAEEQDAEDEDEEEQEETEDQCYAMLDRVLGLGDVEPSSSSRDLEDGSFPEWWQQQGGKTRWPKEEDSDMHSCFDRIIPALPLQKPSPSSRPDGKRGAVLGRAMDSIFGTGGRLGRGQRGLPTSRSVPGRARVVALGEACTSQQHDVLKHPSGAGDSNTDHSRMFARFCSRS